MDFSGLGEFVGQVGFPVFVAAYVLTRLEPTIGRLSDNVRLLSILLARLQGISAEEVEKEYGNGKR